MSFTNSTFIDALNCQQTSRPPIWLMRQAGRYMKEYLAIKEKHSFLTMCKTPDLCADITLLPVDLLNVDAAILFSDILVIAEAMGGNLSFEKGAGPVFSNPIQHPRDIENYTLPNIPEKLNYVGEGIKAVKERLKNEIPLIGFAGAPFTILSYLLEGRSSSNFKKTKLFIYNHPREAHQLLSKITDATIEYLTFQIQAGVDVVQLFDTWSNMLTYDAYKEFAHSYNQKIIQAIKKINTPIISFSKASSIFYPEMVKSVPNAISFDWNVNFTKIAEEIPKNIAVQGALDPSILYADQKVIKAEAEKIVSLMKDRSGFIFNLGHGIMPDIPFENVKFLVDTIKSM